MGEMTIRGIDDALMVELREMAAARGADPSDLARDLITSGLRGPGPLSTTDVRPLSTAELERRDRILQDLRDIRAMTLEPLTFDSTLYIREMRDADG